MSTAPTKSASGAPQNPASAPASDEAPGMPGASSLSTFFGGSVGALARTALGQTVGRAVHLENVDMVGHANVATGGAERVTVKSILAISHGETCGE